MFRHNLVVAALCVTALAGCPTRNVSSLDPHETPEIIKEIPINVNRNIDVLFVIDNSGSMKEEQDKINANFGLFANILESIEGGLPNLHMGVVSSDTGIGQTGGGCDPNGDDGRLQNGGGALCGLQGYYISDEGGDPLDPNYPNRAHNYTGTLEDTFTCIAELGTGGCGLEQHLESMKRALDNHNAQNQGFLRENAYLAVIFLADEDDCSAQDSAVFDPSQTEVTDTLGPFGSFRCTEYGVMCDGGNISRSPASYEVCEPRGDSYMWHPDHYVTFLKGLKDDPRSIIVAGIIGNPEPFAVQLNTDNEPELSFSCGSMAAGSLAVPGVRLKYFIDQFPDRSTFTSICADDFGPAMEVIAQLLKKVIGTPCLEGDYAIDDINSAMPGLQLDCQVSDVQNYQQEGESQTVIPRCDMQNDDTPVLNNLPCWWVDQTPEVQCGAPNLALVVERSGEAPLGTTLVARCAGIGD